MLSFVFERTNVDDKENKLDAKEDYVEDFDGESGEAGDKESKYIIYAAAHNIIYATSPWTSWPPGSSCGPPTSNTWR